MKLISFFILTRPLNFLITFFAVIVAVLISRGKIDNFFIIFLSAFSAGLTASAGNTINDYFDIDSDKINHPGRPLPSEKISKKDALFLYIFLIILSTLLSLFINKVVFFIIIFSHLLLFFYSAKLKRLPLFSNIIVSFLTALAFIYGGITAGDINSVIIPAVFAFLINLIREIVKDIQDVKGDKENDTKTFPVIYGNKVTKNIILVLTVILILFSVYPFITNFYKIEYFILVMIIINPLLIYCMKSLYEDESGKNLKKISNILKFNMVFGLIAIYLGA